MIIATGQSYLLAGIAGEKEFTGRGVAYCVTCDGFFFKNRPVVGKAVPITPRPKPELLAYTKNVTILSHGKPPFFAPVNFEKLRQAGIAVLTHSTSPLGGEDKLEKLFSASRLPMARLEMLPRGLLWPSAWPVILFTKTGPKWRQLDQD